MIRRVYRGILAVVTLLLLACLAGLALLPGHGSKEQLERGNTYNEMDGIAHEIFQYAADHHDKLPQKWSDLVPDYIDHPKTLLSFSLFWSPPYDLDLKTHPELIDMFSAYGFLRLPDHRIVVFERPGFRSDGKMIYCLLGNDGETVGFASTSNVSPMEFLQRLDRGFPDNPDEEESYQKLTCCGCGPYEYDLDIRGERLQSAYRAFLASGKPRITAEEARIKVKAAMDLLDAPGTWQVEKGIEASDGSTPYYHFRCDYMLKGGRDEGKSISALALFDGTVFAPTKQSRPAGL